MEHQVKAYAFIAPSLLILTVFVFIPLAGAIGISLMNIDIYMKNISFAGIANYIKMFQDERVANATFHTFYFALLEVPLQMIVALLLLMFMLRNTKLHKLLRTVFYLPYVCSMTAVSIMWSMLLNTHYGMLPHLLGKIGITMPNMLSSTTWAMPTVIFVTVWKGFGYTLTILSAAALGVSESLYEAAEIDGATGLPEIFLCHNTRYTGYDRFLRGDDVNYGAAGIRSDLRHDGRRPAVRDRDARGLYLQPGISDSAV